MKRSRFLAVAAILALSACASNAPGTLSSSPGQAMLPQGASATNALSENVTKHTKLGHLSFFITIPKRHHRLTERGIHPNYIPPSSSKVTITLIKVNDGAPPSGLTLSKTTTLPSCSSGCTVSGPASPPGTDIFSVTLFNSGNKALATAQTTVAIHLGQANMGSISMLGIPSTFTITGVPAANAGFDFATPAPLSVTALDASGDAIPGTYANSVTLSINDSTNSAQLSAGGGTAANSVVLTGSTVPVSLAYTGLAIVPATISASAASATTKNVSFAPALYAPASVCNQFGSDTTECATPGPQVNIYANTGTGSTATFTLSQVGWYGGGFFKTFTQTNTCSGLIAITTTDNVVYTATAAGNALAGTCDVTVTGGANLTVDVPITYTTSTVGVFGRRHPKPQPKT
jgi:hypothetical protein